MERLWAIVDWVLLLQQIAYADYVNAGSYTAAKDKGLVRLLMSTHLLDLLLSLSHLPV